MLNTILDWLIFNDRAKTKLVMLAFLYCGKIVKNSIVAPFSSRSPSSVTLITSIRDLGHTTESLRIREHRCFPTVLIYEKYKKIMQLYSDYRVSSGVTY